MKSNILLICLLLAVAISVVSAFCWVDGTCGGAPPQTKVKSQTKKGLFAGIAAAPGPKSGFEDELSNRIRAVLKTNWQYLRQKLFLGSWEETLFELEWFVNEVKKDIYYLNFTGDPNIWSFCNIDRINVKNKRTLRFNITLDIKPKFYFQIEEPLFVFVEDSSARFMDIYQNYPNTQDGVIDVITCGEKLFEMLEDVSDHFDSGRRLYPDEMSKKSQEIQDECGVYLPPNAVEPWLDTPAQSAKKPFFNPRILCVKCLGNIFDILDALWIFENCSLARNCMQYGDNIVRNMARDIIDMFETCI